MSYIVTARKWRPKKFSEVVGQEHITATLKNALKNNRIAHAYLFTGPRGVGKTTTARILAKILNCLNPKDYEPCNECEMCLSIQNSQSLDIIEIDGASNRGIDEIRTLRESVKYAPTKGKYKVYIIDEVHMLTKESFNAFLKTLEEPPPHTIFIFATTDAHKVPLTIISRCQRFDFRRIQLDTIKSLLKQIAAAENIQIDDKSLTTIAKKSDGALRDAESYFDQVVSFCGNKIDSKTVAQMLNLIDDEVYFDVSDAIISKDFKSVFGVTQKIYENGWDFVDFINGLIEHFRNLMTVVITEKTDLVEIAEIFRTRYIEYLGKFSEGDLLRLLNYLNKVQQELRYTQNQKLKVEIALSHLIGFERSSTISDVISKIADDKSLISVSSSIPDVNISAQAKKKAGPELSKDSKANYNNINGSSESRTKQEAASYTEKIKEDFNINSVISKWPGFVESIAKEKALILGQFIHTVKPVSLEGNRLFISSTDSHVKDLLKTYEDYFSKKSRDYFGKKITFNYNEPETKGNDSVKTISVEKSESFEKSNPPQEANDPYVSAIITELGGEEIR
jgi:DNA polymerase III subunit gamma/tau